MPADPPTPLAIAAQRRHELTRSKAVLAIRELDRAGTPITFEAVAHTAGVSRSWLYTQPDLRTEIHRLRDLTRRAPSPPLPATQRASDTSLRRRLETAAERIRQLTEENQRLRRQLAQVLGEQRAMRSAPAPHQDRSPATIDGPKK